MKATKTRKLQTNKSNYKSDEAFADLKEAMEGALAFERGERRDLNSLLNLDGAIMARWRPET